jgi:hypothetical protein
VVNTGEESSSSKIQFTPTHMPCSTKRSNAVQCTAVMKIINSKNNPKKDFNLTEMKINDSLSYFFTFFRNFCHLVCSDLLAS